jgi:hypothetical protein
MAPEDIFADPVKRAVKVLRVAGEVHSGLELQIPVVFGFDQEICHIFPSFPEFSLV